MLLVNTGTKTGEASRLNENQADFKVTLIGVPSPDFNGKWSVQYSPDKGEWINHEEMTQLTGNKTGDLYFNIPWIRLVTEGASLGKVKLHVIQGA